MRGKFLECVRHKFPEPKFYFNLARPFNKFMAHIHPLQTDKRANCFKMIFKIYIQVARKY